MEILTGKFEHDLNQKIQSWEMILDFRFKDWKVKIENFNTI
jgi:hypothetical protein